MFAQEFSCPDARVTVVKQHGRPFAPGPPPEEIARDPDRLAVWQQAMAKIAATMADRTYYVTRGCGHDQTYYCMDRYPESKTDWSMDCYDERDPRDPDPDLQVPGAH